MILVEGHMKYKEWEKDGQRKTSENIVADTITLERRGQNHVDNQPQQYTQPVQYEQPTYQSPTYTQQSMMQGSMIPTEVNTGNPNPVDDFGIPEYTGGLDISGDDLPF
jgi:single-stranded DNA-binding protein